ncbi:MAG: hypothetical protein LUO89_12715 [Methanothrix sp.]|nr:hypothetical protein [Methanothrix sp.]
MVDRRRSERRATANTPMTNALKRHQAQTAAELDALLPAVLERAFRGEL